MLLPSIMVKNPMKGVRMHVRFKPGSLNLRDMLADTLDGLMIKIRQMLVLRNVASLTGSPWPLIYS